MIRKGLTRRRSLLLGFSLLTASVAGGVRPALTQAEAWPKLVVSKDPDCGCCGGWINHMRRAGFTVDVVETRDMDRVKTRLGVPGDLVSCHTTEVAGYVVEGHVPADALKRLLMERPLGRGIAVPGMPTWSPGMEAPGAPPEDYQVVLFGPAGRTVFARYRGQHQI